MTKLHKKPTNPTKPQNQNTQNPTNNKPPKNHTKKLQKKLDLTKSEKLYMYLTCITLFIY